MMEDIGVRAIVDGVDSYVKDMGKMQDATNKTTGTLDQTKVASEKTSEMLRTNLRPALTAVTSAFNVTAAAMMFMFAGNENMSEGLRTTLKIFTGLTLAMNVITSLYRLWAARAAIATAAQWALNIAMSANPIGLIIIAIAALIAAIVVLFVKWDTVVKYFKITAGWIKDAFITAWEAIKTAAVYVFKGIATVVLGPMQLILEIIKKVIDGVKSIPLIGDKIPGIGGMSSFVDQALGKISSMTYIPSSATTNNTYNFNVSANYQNPQQPASIASDLESIRIMSRV